VRCNFSLRIGQVRRSALYERLRSVAEEAWTATSTFGALLQLKPHKHCNCTTHSPIGLHFYVSEILQLPIAICHQSNLATAAMDVKEPLLPSEPPPSYEDARQSPLPHNTAPKSGGSRLRPPPPPLDLPCLNELRKSRVVLASKSPRRRQLLAQVRTAFQCPLRV
jgi:hypothetical protein